MQHRDGYGTEHDRNEKRGTEVSQEDRDWSYEEAEQYYKKFAWERDDDEVEDDEVEQEEAGNLYPSDNTSGEEFGEDDKDESTYTDYTDLHFRYRKNAHGRINGKPWKPPSSKGLRTPVFVRLQDLQSQKPAKAPAVEVDASDGR